MSYYATYKPTAEAMEKYKPEKSSGWFSSSPNYLLTEAKLRLLEISMTDKYEDKSISDLAMQVRLAVAEISRAAELQTRAYVWDKFKEEGEVWFCGWKYSRDEELGFENEEEFQNQILERIFTYARLIKHPDYFDRDSREDWEDLYNDISEYIDFVHTEYSDYYDNKFMEEMKDFKVKDKEESLNSLTSFSSESNTSEINKDEEDQ